MRKLILLLIILASLSSCKKFMDVNDTPNNPISVPPSVLLPAATVGIAWANSDELGRGTELMMQHIAGTLNSALIYDVYNLDNAFDIGWSSEIYSGSANNLVKLIQDYSTTSPAYSGIAKLELAYVLSMATDLWGDAPYSQAAQGLRFPSPRFDKVEDIYQGNAADSITSLFDLVRDGMADLDKTSLLKPGVKDDVVYSGTLDNWKRMGNTLLLKFAIQLTNVNPALAKSTIDAVIAGNNYINSNALDFQVPFGSTVGNQNALYAFNNVNRQSDQMLSSRFLTLMTSLHDTVRLAKYFTKPGGVFTAFNNGSTAVPPALATRSKYNTYLTGASGEAPIRLLTFAQVNFILAESALMLGTAGDPNTYYQAGIKANMQKIGMTTAEINTYFNDNPTVVNLTGAVEDKRKQIITQKYISWTGNGIETYNDYRRTGYPELALALNAAGQNPLVLPKRFPYTPGEQQRNPNLPDPLPKTDQKIWWGK